MTDKMWSIDATLAAEIDEAAKEWRQGDIFRDVAIVWYADASRPLTFAVASAGSGRVAAQEALTRAAIISQTCDTVRTCSQRPLVHIAAVVALDGQVLEEARRGWRPQYVAIPWLGPNDFVDLEMQGMVEKSVLLTSERLATCSDPERAIGFAQGLARHRSRFAFPDDLAPTLAPLVNRLRDKAGKDTPQGRRIHEIKEIRVRAMPTWDTDSISVELVFLMSLETLPTQPSADDPVPADLMELGKHDAQGLAELLDNANLSPTERNALWQRLADAWSQRAKPTGAVREVTAVAVPLGEFSWLEALSTPQLDLDHLSE